MKEAIGDALRNAAMRFGAALDLWHKGDLHVDEPEPVQCISPAQELELIDLAREVGVDQAKFLKWCGVPSFAAIPAQNYMDARNALEGKRPKTVATPELGDDEIPY